MNTPGQIAFQAYCKSRDNKDVRGGTIPDWQSLSPEIREAWEVEANAVLNMRGNSTNWKAAFTPRERKEIEFSQVYANQFGHGTDGHNAKLIIAKMANILESNVIVNLPPAPVVPV